MDWGGTDRPTRVNMVSSVLVAVKGMLGHFTTAGRIIHSRETAGGNNARPHGMALGLRRPGIGTGNEAKPNRGGAVVQFVLVHGGWQGAWCWDGVAATLRSGGHQVFAPTLRGSEDGEVDRTGVDITAIGKQLMGEISDNGLSDLVLVGHSGGGPVIQYVADRLCDITRRVVFVDAWVLLNGEAIHDVLPSPLVEAARAAAAQSADNSVPMDPEVWESHFMNGADIGLVAATISRLVRVPLGWLEEPISLPRFWFSALPSSYVFLRDDQGVSAELYGQMAQRLGFPRVVECDGPHEAMLTHPAALAEAILAAAKD
jgi:pimeloyl-ACP methyl ester carboxylesterase